MHPLYRSHNVDVMAYVRVLFSALLTSVTTDRRRGKTLLVCQSRLVAVRGHARDRTDRLSLDFAPKRV